MADTPEQKAQRADLRQAFAQECYPSREPTKSEWGRIARGVGELMALGPEVNGDVLVAAATRYRSLFPAMPCTPQALTGNWSRLQPQAQAEGLRQFVMDTWPEARGWPASTWDTWNRELADYRPEVEAAIRLLAQMGERRAPTWGMVWQQCKQLRSARHEQERLNEAARRAGLHPARTA